MKKLFLLSYLCCCCLFCYAQISDEFLMQPSSSDVLQSYVGQNVMVMSYNDVRNILYDSKAYDEYMFRKKFNGRVGEEYKIKKIKGGKQIVLELEDKSGTTIKAIVNVNGERDYKGMQSCKSFFLIGKFEDYKKKKINSPITNKDGKEVAKIIDIKLSNEDNSEPQIRYVIKSDLDDSVIECKDESRVKYSCEKLGTVIQNKNGKPVATITGFTPVESSFYYTLRSNLDSSRISCGSAYFSELCKYLGIELSNPRVKRHYIIKGFKESILHSGINNAQYIIEDPNNKGDLHYCSVIDPEETAFEKDLSGHYSSSLVKVEKPANSGIRYGKTNVIQDDNVSKYSYIDNVIDILIFGTGTQFDFSLKNISNNSIKVIWNEAVFVDYDGTSSKVMHAGTKYSQREADQPATTIIKGAKIEDIAVPTCNVRYSEVSKDWVTDSMYPSLSGQKPGQLRLMLPIQIKDVINEYVFIFDVKYVYNYPELLNF